MLLSTDLSNGFDTFLFGIPLLVLLFFGFFRLDETMTKRKKKIGAQGPPAAPSDPSVYPRQTPQSLDPRRSNPMSDPDGRPWAPRVGRKR